MEQKLEVLNKFLELAAFDGWSEKTLKNACKALGIPYIKVRKFFPDDVRDVVVSYAESAGEYMESAYIANNGSKLKVRERIKFLVKARIEFYASNKESVRRLFAYLLMPLNAPFATKILYQTVDDMWRLAGDTSTDYNFYTKRALLAGVFNSTMLFWLSDNSENNQQTWDFLDRRIEEVMKVGKLSTTIKDRFKSLFGMNA